MSLVRDTPAGQSVISESCAVVIVVVNWNRKDLTLGCLQSLQKLDYPDSEVVVIDNGSVDDSVLALRRRYPEVCVIETSQNLGYSGGNNVGIRYALTRNADFVCILNNDVVIAPDFLGPLLAACRQQPDVGVATPLIIDSQRSEQVWALGAALDPKTGTVTRLHAGDPEVALRQCPPFEVDAASGAAMLVRREVLEQVGLLDEQYYLYFEEIDWCTRVRQAGYRVLAVPSSVVWHTASATLGRQAPAIDYYMFRNHLRFAACHWSGLARWRLVSRIVLRGLLTIAAYTAKPDGGRRIPHRNARLLALRDAALGRWGKMGPDVAAVCTAERR